MLETNHGSVHHQYEYEGTPVLRETQVIEPTFLQI